VLNPVAQPREANPAEGGWIIEVGPVTVPDYLERPQVVTRVSSNELRLSESNQWVEPLEQNIARVIAENLSTLLTCERVVFYPAMQSIPVDYQVAVQIIRFDADEEGATVLEALWRITGAAGETIAPEKRSRFESSARELTYDAIAAEMSAVLGKLCEEITFVIESER
jgi:uncharacterized lipoprotein YmbA